MKKKKVHDLVVYIKEATSGNTLLVYGGGLVWDQPW